MSLFLGYMTKDEMYYPVSKVPMTVVGIDTMAWTNDTGEPVYFNIVFDDQDGHVWWSSEESTRLYQHTRFVLNTTTGRFHVAKQADDSFTLAAHINAQLTEGIAREIDSRLFMGGRKAAKGIYKAPNPWVKVPGPNPPQ